MTRDAVRWLGICVGGALAALALAHCSDDDGADGPSAEQCESWSSYLREDCPEPIAPPCDAPASPPPVARCQGGMCVVAPVERGTSAP
jgi:hypothetical protein